MLWTRIIHALAADGVNGVLLSEPGILGARGSNFEGRFLCLHGRYELHLGVSENPKVESSFWSRARCSISRVRVARQYARMIALHDSASALLGLIPIPQI